jgi:hypothetical protein
VRKHVLHKILKCCNLLLFISHTEYNMIRKVFSFRFLREQVSLTSFVSFLLFVREGERKKKGDSQPFFSVLKTHKFCVEKSSQ